LAIRKAAWNKDIQSNTLFSADIKKAWVGLGTVFACALYFLAKSPQIHSFIVLIALCTLLAYVIRKGSEEASRFTSTLDNERRLRYELEQAKAQLLHASKEIFGITEVKERNRIAREIHDSVGHNLAGTLIYFP